MSLSYYKNAILTDTKTLWKEFSFKGSNSKLAIKTGISCVIAFMLANYLEFDQAYWTLITCMIMQMPTVGSAVEKGVVRISATLVGVISSVLIFGLFPLLPIFYTLSIFTVAFICYYNTAKSNDDYFWYLLILTFMIIFTVGFELDDPRDIVYTAFNRGVEILLGVVVSLVVSITIWPNHASKDFYKKIKKIRRDNKIFVTAVFTQYMSLEYDKTAITAQYQNLKKQITTIQSLLKFVKFEKKIDNSMLRKIASEYEELDSYLEEIYTFYHTISHSSTARYHLNYLNQLRKILLKVEEVTLYSEENDSLPLSSFKSEIEELFKAVKIKYEKKYKLGRTFNYTVTDVVIFNESVLILSNYFDIYLNITLEGNQHSLPSSIKKVPKKDRFAYEEYSLAGVNFYLHFPSLKHALRTSLMLISAIWVFMLLELPQDTSGLNLSVAIMTICIPDPVASKIKAILRFSGCLVGATLGLLFIGMDVQSTAIMLCCMFAVVYLAGYIKSGGANISYAGLQIALAYFIASFPSHGFAQILDTTEIFNRLICIFFGVIFAWIFKSYIWKDNHLRNIKKVCASFWSKFNGCNVRSGRNYYSKTLLDGVKSLSSEVTKFAITSDVNKEDLLKLRKLCDYIEMLTLASKTIAFYSRETANFVYGIDPVLFNDFDRLLSVFHFTVNEKELDQYDEQISALSSKLEYFKFTMRGNRLVRDKSMEFKQNYSHYIVSSIRVIDRLKDINSTFRALLPLLNRAG